MGVARFAKGSIEAKEYMATIREKARLNREAIANGDLEKIDKPKREKKTKKVKEAVIFKEKEEEPIISEEEEEEPIRKVEASLPIPPPKQFSKTPKQVKEEPKEEPKKVEPVKKTKVVEEKPIIVKVPPKKVKKIIIQEEEEEPEYEVEYRKAVPKKVPAVKKEVVNNIKDEVFDNPLLSSRVYRNR
jgi:hypothetical protein